MVFIADEGAQYDAPIDLVWRYAGGEGGFHGPAHTGSLRRFKWRQLTKNVGHWDAERKVRGRWRRFGGEVAEFQPLGTAIEDTVGSTAGSKFFQVYTPLVEKTQVDIYADYRSKAYSEAQLKSVVLELHGGAYREDVDLVREFARSRKRRTPSARAARASLHLRDVGSTFQAPLQVVWEYLFDGKAHDGVHHSTRNGTFGKAYGRAFNYGSERNILGRWTKEEIQITPYRPLGFTYEWVRGPFRGSKMFYVYRPKGAETQIDVHGHFQSRELSPAGLERAVTGMVETDFREDAPAVRAFARSRKKTESRA
jgi:hypothetical protein